MGTLTPVMNESTIALPNIYIYIYQEQESEMIYRYESTDKMYQCK